MQHLLLFFFYKNESAENKIQTTGHRIKLVIFRDVPYNFKELV